MTQRRIHILAGPNGAGKTTFAREYLTQEADCPVFINADLIADGISPFSPDRAAVRAGRIMLGMISDCVRRKESFAFETTLAAGNYAHAIPIWQREGYWVRLHFPSLPSPEIAAARVAERLRQGGHSVPEDVIRRRFEAGRKNFETLYKRIVSDWILYDSVGEIPTIVDYGVNP